MNPSNNDSKETFGIKTTNPAPSVAELKGFENDMYDLVKNVKFKQQVNSTFQNTLKQNIRELNQENKIYVAADKTSNYYKVEKDDYEEMILKNVTKDYKKTNDKFVDKVNEKDKDIAEKLELDDRIYAFSKRDAYITIKDHKENFRNNTKCRLINPSKSRKDIPDIPSI